MSFKKLIPPYEDAGGGCSTFNFYVLLLVISFLIQTESRCVLMYFHLCLATYMHLR